jgi:hypothetical protein
MGGRPGGGRALPDLIRLAQSSCPLTSCGISSVADEREVLVIRAVAQRKLGPTISANTRWAVRFSPD